MPIDAAQCLTLNSPIFHNSLTYLIHSDLLWAITQDNSSYLVKSRTAGGVQFSKDPLNLTGKNSSTHGGFINPKALGIRKLKDGSIELSTKVSKNTDKPSKAVAKTVFKPSKNARSVAAAVSKTAAGYRDDLRYAAVVRASALTRSAKAKKTYAEKPARK